MGHGQFACVPQDTPDTTIGRTGIPRGVPDCSINSGRDPGLRKNRIRDPELPKNCVRDPEDPRNRVRDPEDPRNCVRDPEVPRNCVRDPELWCFQPGSRIENTGFRDPEDIVFAMFMPVKL